MSPANRKLRYGKTVLRAVPAHIRGAAQRFIVESWCVCALDAIMLADLRSDATVLPRNQQHAAQLRHAPCNRVVQCRCSCRNAEYEQSRRSSLAYLSVSVAAAVTGSASAPAHAATADMQRLLQAFQTAMTAPNFEAAERAWGEAIRIAPDSGPAYSNRGTIRLQDGRCSATTVLRCHVSISQQRRMPSDRGSSITYRWSAAKQDFLRALELDAASGAKDNAALLNNLGVVRTHRPKASHLPPVTHVSRQHVQASSRLREC